jgi:hypothetical protein
MLVWLQRDVILLALTVSPATPFDRVHPTQSLGVNFCSMKIPPSATPIKQNEDRII